MSRSLPSSFDLAIVGAGPGGSAAAIIAARAGARVLLIEKDQFPRHKVCGEFISSESASLLADLIGADDAPLFDRVRLFRGERVHEGRLSSPASSMTRSDLDHSLLRSAIEAGTSVVLDRILEVTADGGQFVLRGKAGVYRASAVINAAGRWSELREDRSLPIQRFIGIKQHMRETAPPLSTDLYFFAGGYCGVQPVGPDTINVCALVDAAAATSFDEILRRAPALARRAHNWQPLFAPIITAPITFGWPTPVTRGMANVGDAAAFIDPFLGDGISIALQTGVMAAQPLLRAVTGKVSFNHALQAYAQEYDSRVAPALRRAARLRRWSRSRLAWQAMRLPRAINLAAALTRVKTA